MNQKMA
jgi:hypothetical protein